MPDSAPASGECGSEEQPSREKPHTMTNVLRTFYEEKYRDSRERSRTSKLFTLECVPPQGHLRVLDVGCGSGENSLAIAAKGHQVFGIDLSENAIAKYCGHGFRGRTMDIEQGLDFSDGSFDLVFCSEVIEHLAAPAHLLNEAFRVLVPGGRMILSTPNSAFWVYRVLAALGWTLSELQHPQHLHFFSRRSLHRLLSATGFHLDDMFGRNMYLLIPTVNGSIGDLLIRFGMQKEERFRTKSFFMHLSNRSHFWNSLWADTLIVVASKPLSTPV
ncbi:MAG TPA: class I SAM-dependent methyltransferase [Stellaceae bacterium]|nr:class I SAM-dependent methyltransferase [Stellaceae bacterium]